MLPNLSDLLFLYLHCAMFGKSTYYELIVWLQGTIQIAGRLIFYVLLDYKHFSCPRLFTFKSDERPEILIKSYSMGDIYVKS